MRESRSVYCRVSVLAPTTRVDVALPVDVPIAELVPMLLELLGEPSPARPPVGWRLSGIAGGVLPPDTTLAELGVPDGELLRLAPASVPPPPPVFDDPIDALAATTTSDIGPSRGRLVAALLCTVTVAAILLPAVRLTGGDIAPVIALGAVASLLALAGIVVLRSRDADHQLQIAVAVAAVLLAAGVAVTATPGALGAGHVLAAAVSGGTVAALAQILLRVITPVIVATVVVALPVAVAATLRLQFGIEPAHLAAGVGAAALSVGPLLARAALRLSGVPRPVVPTDATDLIAADSGPDLLPPAELAQRTHLARGYLAGGVAGTAVLAAGATLPVAIAGGWAGTALAVVTVAVLALRSRGFTDPIPVFAQQAAALAAGLAVTASAALTTGPTGCLVAATGLIVVTAVAALAGARPERPASPITRRVLDVVEALLTCTAVPLALGVMGVYGLVRGL